MKKLLTFLTKRATLMRRPTVLTLLRQLVVLVQNLIIKLERKLIKKTKQFKMSNTQRYDK